MNLLNKLYNFVIITSKLFNIDESHSITHSMNVYYYANKIYNYEHKNKVNITEMNRSFSGDSSLFSGVSPKENTTLEKHKNIIDVSAILHDMCDKKYMDEKIGIERINNFIQTELKTEITNPELDIIKKIISTMSYSTIKKNGFPDLQEYQLAYNIVREADLLTSYDFDRCIIYNMIRNNNNYEESFKDALNVFENRVFKYHDDNLFFTKYSLIESHKLKIDAINRIKVLKNIIR